MQVITLCVSKHMRVKLHMYVCLYCMYVGMYCMCVYAYVPAGACIHVSMHVCVYVGIHALCTHVFGYVYIHTHKHELIAPFDHIQTMKRRSHMYVFMYVCMYVCMCMYVCVYVCMYVCMYACFW